MWGSSLSSAGGQASGLASRRSTAVRWTPGLPGLSDWASWSGRVQATLSSLKPFEHVIYFNTHSDFKLNYFPVPPQIMGLICSLSICSYGALGDEDSELYGLKQGNGETIDVAGISIISLKHTDRSHHQAGRLKPIFHGGVSLPAAHETLKELLGIHLLSGQIGSLTSFLINGRPLTPSILMKM